MSAEIEVTGLRELKNAFKRVNTDLPKELRLAFKKIAEDVVGKVRSKVPSVTGRAASSVVPRASQTGAGIAIGGTKAEYYPWLDFGGGVGRDKSIRRTFIKTGRYVYPTIEEESENIERGADNAMATVAKKAGFETSGEG